MKKESSKREKELEEEILKRLPEWYRELRGAWEKKKRNNQTKK